MLSKSRIIRGVQCHKSLWLHKHQPQLREISDDLQAVFDTGTQVGLLAQQKFPGGTDASEGHEWPNFECADTTKYLLGIGQKVNYEATFVHNKVLVAVDILVKNELGSWDAYEVKSTNSLKSPHIMDCAIQFHVITSYSLDIRSFSVMHFNKKYVRQGELDIKQLFTSTDITEEVLELQEEMPEVIDELEAIQQQKTCPELAIGSHCDEPYECDFKAYCWKHIPEYSVFDLTNPRNRDWELYEKGILKIKDIPVDYAMGEKHRIQHLAEITGKSHIVKDEIDHFLSDLEYPIYYFDFETMMTAVPMYDNTRTYQQIPFQYSVHKQPSFGAECEHREFLPQVESGVKSPDPREELISHLVRDLGEKGSIVAYHSSFEQSRIKELARDFPEYSEPLLALTERIIDLEIPFRRKWYYTKEMQGRSSIKKVLPALVPELSYSDLEIQDGGSASTQYLAMHQGEYEGDYPNARKNLLDYCELDTFAMVKVLEKLFEVIA